MRAELAFRDRGPRDAPALVWLHGFMGSRRDWEGFVAPYTERFRCLLVDLPGHGDSVDVPDEAFGMEGAADLLWRTLDAAGVSRPVLIGYSLGGRVLLQAVTRRPRAVSGCVPISARPGIEDAGERAARRARDAERALELREHGMAAFVEAWYRQPLFASLRRDLGLLESISAGRRAGDSEAMARVVEQLSPGRSPPLWQALADWSVPTLAVAGALDETYVALARRMEGLSDRVRVGIVRGAGHAVHLEQPAALQQLLDGFLAERTPAGP